METATCYTEMAKELVQKVQKINSAATIVYNWSNDRELVIKLIAAYHKNIGDDFLNNPYDYLSPDNFK